MRTVRAHACLIPLHRVWPPRNSGERPGHHGKGPGLCDASTRPADRGQQHVIGISHVAARVRLNAARAKYPAQRVRPHERRSMSQVRHVVRVNPVSLLLEAYLGW